MEIYIVCFLIGLIGVAFQIIFKIRSLIEKATVGNIRFNWKDYFKQDMFSIILSLLSIVLAEFFIRDTLMYVENHTLAMPLIKLTFATLGYAGADISSRLFGRASKMLNAIIDKKTNVADGIE